MSCGLCVWPTDIQINNAAGKLPNYISESERGRLKDRGGKVALHLMSGNA